MHIRRAFTFVFDDPRWAPKLGIAILLSVVPSLFGLWPLLRNFGVVTAPAVVASPLFVPATNIALIPVYGFLFRITRDVAAGSDVPLPEWSDVRGILHDGAKLWVVVILWRLPEIAARLVVGDSGNASGEGQSGLETLVLLGGLVIFVIESAAVAWLATTGSVAAGLNVGEVLATVRRNLGGYVLVNIVSMGAFSLIIVLGAVLLWPVWQGTGRALSRDELPVYFAMSLGVASLAFAPYVHCVSHHLYG
jgi:hypothetical protein